MDRPVTSLEKGKEYVSPQYIVDSINNLFLLPTKPYLPGQVSSTLSFLHFIQPVPPHLSPFVNNESEGYIPDRQREINTLAGIETAVIDNDQDSSSSEEEEKKKVDSDDDIVRGDADSSDDESSSEEEQPIKKKDLSAQQKAKKEEKLKAELKKEQEDMGKMLMTQRQRKIYQKAEESRKAKQQVV